MCDIDVVERLTARDLKVIGNEPVRECFRSDGDRIVKKCDFAIVAGRHYWQVDWPLLSEME